ncbi:hypothetical protein [Burkholderia vietnamiensis]|uniref:hypothetical protein n=1 Tax=Burkholderia vietnamiensis TaxID=60552 RepID=UPI001CF42CD6|nr:hypothetical protein [Burkholderia vietnamiensis]MCA8289779.1 hypothetical protein [Burkholderia vietnamiensis]
MHDGINSIGNDDSIIDGRAHAAPMRRAEMQRQILARPDPHGHARVARNGRAIPFGDTPINSNKRSIEMRADLIKPKGSNNYLERNIADKVIY